ncbi:putative ARM repeat superfamily protein [Tripterygium wilfordii]|uniref:RING-type E3 ubiquitin transferase n=1 Tax=Tripterygium wilfordii TaxID=458696 RepID=A0A7J7DN12_TRIWF|nr:U-box domain-containing protein 16-like [Tripterygium wilfordii]KAF5747669.1 putative ARM repeat superfamily protein [Tripterygium wilfordii]
MAISPQSFPPRKRRPPASSFMTPNLSDRNLLQSVLELSREISSSKPLQFLQKHNSLSIIRKSKLLAILFEELFSSSGFDFYSPSMSILLCFEELYIVLQRIKALLEDCFNGCKLWLLMQNELVAGSFHELTVELSTLLDIFPVKEFDLNEDVKELLILIRKQSSQTKLYIDPREDNLQQEVLSILDRIKREIVPDHSKLAEIFKRLGLCDSLSCREEIESLEDEVRNQVDEKSKSEVVGLIGLVRYAKCVLFGPSTTLSSNYRRRKSISEMNVPSDFRCPISLELMRDPVVVATGQTYDRESINLWIESGHNTCPKTGQNLAHNNWIPNLALKNLIAMWCRQHRIPFDAADGNQKLNGVINKAALEATKMTASFLVNKLSVSQSPEESNGVVYELRILAKANSDNRACIAEAGAIPFLVTYLGSDVASKLPNLQVNAVTTILNLSILQANKTRIVETDGALNAVIEVLQSGATWEAKGNAAATIFSLSGVHSYRRKLARKTRVIKGLTDLARDGPTCSRRDAMVAILNLAGARETVGKLIEGGVVEMAIDVMNALPEEAVTILEALVRRGGLVAIAAAHSAIGKLGLLLREGSEMARESAAATLVTICRKGGSDMVGELAAIPRIERVIWELMGAGTVRARRKAGTLLRILRRWAAGLDGQVTEGYGSTTTAVIPSRTALTT